jgi:hypothetical protein
MCWHGHCQTCTALSLTANHANASVGKRSCQGRLLSLTHHSSGLHTVACQKLLRQVSAPSYRVCRLPASENPEVFRAQQTMFEAWSIVGELSGSASNALICTIVNNIST